MLASIHPLGERARHNRWSLTVAAYTAGSTVAGAAFGALLGLAGAVVAALSGTPTRPAVLAAVVVCAAAAALDMRRRQSLPTVRRQVNEDWLNRYRGWVYGAGFGGQLGVGVVTIVTTAGVYASFGLAALAGSASGSAGRGALSGMAVGAMFGLVRALPLVMLGRMDHPRQIMALHRRLASAAQLNRTASAGGLVVIGGLLGMWLLR